MIEGVNRKTIKRMQAGLIERPDMRGRVHKTYEEAIPKLYWSIGEVAAMLNVRTSAIRFWLMEFDVHVNKNRKGDRRFRAEDVAKVMEIHRLIKVEGLVGWRAKEKYQQYLDNAK